MLSAEKMVLCSFCVPIQACKESLADVSMTTGASSTLDPIPSLDTKPLAGRGLVSQLTLPGFHANEGGNTSVGDKWPNAHIMGMDLSAIQPRSVPPRVSFFIDDIEHPNGWEFPRITLTTFTSAARSTRSRIARR